MSIQSVTEWNEMLNQAISNPGLILCTAATPADFQPKLSVVAKADYHAYLDGNHGTYSSCRKLTLRAIWNVSQQFMPLVRSSILEEELTSLLLYKDTCTRTEILSFIQQKIDALTAVKSLVENNQKLHEKITKKYQCKRKGFCGKLQRLPQSWRLARLDRAFKDAIKSIPCNQKFLETTTEFLKQRLFACMDGFEAEIETANRNDFKNDPMIGNTFATPQDIEEKWLSRYGNNKYCKLVPEYAENNRKRVYQFLDLWKAVENKFRKNSLPAEEKSTRN